MTAQMQSLTAKLLISRLAICLRDSMMATNETDDLSDGNDETVLVPKRFGTRIPYMIAEPCRPA